MRGRRIWVEAESSTHLGFVENTPSHVSDEDFVPPRGFLRSGLPPIPPLTLMSIGWRCRGTNQSLVRVSNLRQDGAVTRARARTCAPRAAKNLAPQLQLRFRHLYRICVERVPVESNTLLLRPMSANHKLIAPGTAISANIHVEGLAGMDDKNRCFFLRDCECW